LGSAKRNRKKYEKPKDIWNLARINADNDIIREFGLKNMRELWKAQSEVSRLRRNVRLLLSGSSPEGETTRGKILGRLSKYGMASDTSTLDNLLDLNEKTFLGRRLQTIVFKKGLAKTIKQARQLITHGYISIEGRRVNRPGYLVSVKEEEHIGYYKPIDIGKIEKKEETAAAPAATAATAT
jgi:small subunit ribosomal protein S4